MGSWTVSESSVEGSTFLHGSPRSCPSGTVDKSPMLQLWVAMFDIDQVPKERLNVAMSYVSSYYHCVFSTKDRQRLITHELSQRLWPFLGGIARQNEMKAVEIGGTPDHVHILLSLPSTFSISKALQLIKGGSSKWINDTFPEQGLFRWQIKYGAFSVSESQVDKIVHYIQNQEAHHRKMTFQEEFLALLEKHRIEYDPKYLWE